MQQRLRWVDSLRGVAALSVAVFHLYTQNGGPLLSDGMPGLVNHAAVVGRYGVELFFVISGFVLAYTLLPREDILSPKDVGLYFVRRSVRLDPPYLVVLALYVLLFGAFVAAEGPVVTDHAMSLSRLFWSAFYFLPRPVELYVLVAWTLAIEVQFYLLFAVIALLTNHLGAALKDRGKAIFLLLAAMVAAASLPRFGVADTMDWGFWMYPHLSTFAVGATAAAIVLRVRGAALLFAINLAVVAYAGLHGQGRSLAALIFGVTLLPCIASGTVRRWLENPVLLFFGAISYCLYLLHQLVGSIFIEWVQTWFGWPGAPQLAVVAIGIGVVVAASTLLHFLVEKPAIAWSKKVRFGTPRRAPPRVEPVIVPSAEAN